MKTCLVNKCYKKSCSNGLCSTHKTRLRDHGSPHDNGIPPIVNIDGEIWKPTQESDNYLVSNFGRVKSLKRMKGGRFGMITLPERVLIPNKRKYNMVQICTTEKIKLVSIHRLVAKAFLDNPVNKPFVNHIDGNKTNNHVSNLEWCTHKENMIHASLTGLIHKPDIEKSRISKLTYEDANDIRMFAKAGIKQNDIAKFYPVCRQSINKIVAMESWILEDDSNE